jgi:hypothetical protein
MCKFGGYVRLLYKDSEGFLMGGQHSAGKGDKYRPIDYKKWSENWDKIFGKKKPSKKRKSGLDSKKRS